jgi:hypothetical protein
MSFFIFYWLPVLVFITTAIALVRDPEWAYQMDIRSYLGITVIVIVGLVPIINFAIMMIAIIGIISVWLSKKTL